MGQSVVRENIEKMKWNREGSDVTSAGPATAADCVRIFRESILDGSLGITTKEIQAELRGKDLACWCRLDQPCHASILLEIANRETP